MTPRVVLAGSVALLLNSADLWAFADPTLWYPCAARPWRIVKTGSSSASPSELPLTFGLGQTAAVDGVRVAWPSGRVDRIGALQANQTVTIQEGSGVVGKAPIGATR